MAKSWIPGALMIPGSASDIRACFAEAIQKCSHTGSQSELIALAWTLRNRAASTADGTALDGGITRVEALELSRGLLADVGADAVIEPPCANGGEHTSLPHAETGLQQAIACVSLVFDGLLPDPTNGASRVHPHDQAPDWADDFQATALIGPLMFLREPSEDREEPKHSTTSQD